MTTVATGPGRAARHVFATALFVSVFALPAGSDGRPDEGLGQRKELMAQLTEGSTRHPRGVAYGPVTVDIPLRRAAHVLAAIRPESPSTFRGIREASIYAKAAPAVVLVVGNSGIGSGSLISSDGMVLTNWHIVEGQREVGVIFKPAVEGAELTSKDLQLGVVVKLDEVTDLAVIKVREVPMRAQPLQLGSLDDVQVGSDVHAIGHPTGEVWTYTKGLVSQIRRGYKWSTQSKRQHRADVIQTQTPINPGNSGGPLISDNGTLVGVNSFKGDGEGLNFAVSVDEAKRFLAQSGNRYADTVTSAPKEKITPAPRCEIREIRSGRSRQNDADVRWYDTNCDGRWDAVLTTPDDTQRPITLSVDSKDAGIIDIIVVDSDRDGRWDVSYHDLDGDGKPDLIGHHPDGTLKPSRFERFAQRK